ncbi:GTP pyrophosphokinase [bacterium BMS3Bbin06]|nr:GTP pyrophosphokinase [bacterium BMS3Abin08]GBE34431.1 GTP pyrophosphokinase [bacterium BMS3Bbin06]HDO35769.1 bifunctional (p)ppGpp synthetase/guanosine-3',5'-bis(diphosphate) 3'-pyrophosphohydrolase [Nitrospirota bacterium]
MRVREHKLLSLDELTDKIASYAPGTDTALLRKAYFFSHEAHCSQKRKEGTPYIDHPLSVASILSDMHMDTTSIIAGLLHDTVEDTETNLRDIRDIFGEDVAFLVEALTKLSKMQFKTQLEAQAENFRKMFLAMAEDIRVILIKFADRLHNMRTLGYLPPSKQKRIAQETLDIYAPLANRLGIGWMKVEFENLSFKYLYPDIYKNLLKKVAKRREEQEVYINEVSKKIRKKLIEYNIPGFLSGRVKHLYGIYKKMITQKIPLDQVYDVLGLRIITDTKGHCYEILGIIHSLWKPIPGRFKDYIALPKSNLYQSLHTSVIGPQGERVEFQIRTQEMHRIAEEGIAAHWMYKEGGRVLEKDAKYIKWLRELIQSQQDLRDAKEFLEVVKGEVVPDVVYVFTPGGEIKELPAGSTPIDFAYSIHTEVGHRCVGAKVNGRIIPLRYHLQSGDTVEIVTSPSHGPSRDWLNFVVTQRAKNRIKQWIKSEERKQSLELGHRILETELRKKGLSPKLIKSPEMDEVAKLFSMKSSEDLLVSIGYGKVSAHQVINRFLPDKKDKDEEEIVIKKPRKKKDDQKGISIKGIDNVLYHIANCCHPIPGDQLVGFVTRGKGVTIHREDCPNLNRLVVDDARLIDVTWMTTDNSTAPAKLYVETLDKPGILATLSALISSMNVNISHLSANATDYKRAHLTIIVEVRDREQLAVIMQKIASTEGVLRVKR